jgi:hypothetical protein
MSICFKFDRDSEFNSGLIYKVIGKGDSSLVLE